MAPTDNPHLQNIPETLEVSGIGEYSFSNIQDQFGDYGTEYLEPLLYGDESQGISALGEDKIKLILEIFETRKDTPDFQKYIAFNYLPYNAGSLEDFISKFPLDESGESLQGIDQVVETVTDAASTAVAAAVGEAEAAVEAVVASTATEEADAASTAAEEADAEARLNTLKEESIEILYQGLIDNDIYTDILKDAPTDLTGRINFINSHFTQLLNTAKDYSNTEFVRLYDQLESLQISGVLVLEGFDNPKWTRRIDDARLAINPEYAEIGPSDVEVIRVGLGDSSITNVSGSIIKGENGEIIDVSGDTATLSLESNGLALEVGEVKNLDTRSQEVQIARLEQEKIQNTDTIGKNTVEITSKNADISRIQNISGESFEDVDMPNEGDNPRTIETKKFTSKLPIDQRLQFIKQSENASGETFKLLLIEGLRELVLALSTQNKNLDERNSEIMDEIGVISAGIAAKRDMESLRISVMKEKVEKSLAFINKLGISPVISSAGEVFSEVSSGSPVILSPGNIVTGIDFATMTFEGTFDPVLIGNEGSDDLNTQRIVAQIMNLVLTGDSTHPMEIDNGGVVQYRMNGEDGSDKLAFESLVRSATGGTEEESNDKEQTYSNFVEGARLRLFGPKKSEDNLKQSNDL